MGEEVTVLEDMVKEGFSEMLMFRQSAKKIERTSWAEICGKAWRKSKNKDHGLTAWLVLSREVRYG